MNEDPDRNSLSGIGGWLILPVIGLFLTPIMVGLSIYKDILPTFEPRVWSTLTTVGAKGYHPIFGPYLIFNLIMACVLIIGAIGLLVLLFRKRSIFPKLMIVFYILVIVLTVIDTFMYYNYLLKAFPGLEASMQGEINKQMIRALAGAVIWIPYFSISRRVKYTFVH